MFKIPVLRLKTEKSLWGRFHWLTGQIGPKSMFESSVFFFALRTSLIVSMTDVQIQTSHSYFSLLIEYQVTRGWSRLFVMSNV